MPLPADIVVVAAPAATPAAAAVVVVVVFVGGMSIVCDSLPNIKRNRFFCGVP